jgi:vancomycin resistance protein YoaR
LVIGGAAAVLAIALGVGIGFAGSTDRIPAGVTIDGVDVSGMTAAEAERVLEARAADLAEEPVRFTAAGEEFSVRPKRLGVQANWGAAIDQAMGEGQGFLLFRGFERLALRFQGAAIQPSVIAKQRQVDAALDRFAKAIDTPAREASIVLRGLDPAVLPAQPGRTLARERAEQVLLAAAISLERGEPVPLPVDVAQPTVTAPDLTPVVQQVRTVLSAPVELRYRKTTLTVAPVRMSEFLVLPSEGRTALAVGGDAADAYFANIAKGLDREPRNADFELDGNGQVYIAPSGSGRELDVSRSQGRLLKAALSPTARTSRLAVTTTVPSITTEKAKGMGITGVVSSYTTTFGGDLARLSNVQLVSRLIDDHLIAPGEVFSFNGTTGERNADKGFLEAPVIINGELQTGIGGGVCQVSTTVFNAAFEAGLSIEERTNHALYISHYPTGRDATVNYPDTDLKFTNDTGNWLWLRTFVGSGSLTVNLYGTPVDRRVEIETSPLKASGPIPVKEVPDDTVYVGEQWVEDAGEPARTVSVRRIVYDANGKLMYDTTWGSSYTAEPKIVHVGTKPLPEPVEPVPAETGQASTSGDGQTGTTGSTETQPGG